MKPIYDVNTVLDLAAVREAVEWTRAHIEWLRPYNEQCPYLQRRLQQAEKELHELEDKELELVQPYCEDWELRSRGVLVSSDRHDPALARIRLLGHQIREAQSLSKTLEKPGPHRGVLWSWALLTLTVSTLVLLAWRFSGTLITFGG